MVLLIFKRDIEDVNKNEKSDKNCRNSGKGIFIEWKHH